jgi:hypothetical protein
MGVVYKFTPARRADFIDMLRKTGNVLGSARGVGVTQSYVYRLPKTDQAFADAWADAIDEAVSLIEEEARRRAVDGWDKPVFYRGRQIGAIRRYSDHLLGLLLKMHRPEKFGERRSGRIGPPSDLVERLERARARVAAGRAERVGDTQKKA